jgi:hypothetical protein
MTFEDPFASYSPETRGDLIEYLREYDGTMACSLFHGPEYFFEIRDRGLLVPWATCLRVNQSPAPDIGYFVNANYQLESRGQGHWNISLMGAKKGVYNPRETLMDQDWSIIGLNLQVLSGRFIGPIAPKI